MIIDLEEKIYDFDWFILLMFVLWSRKGDFDWSQTIDVDKNIFDWFLGCCDQDNRPWGGWRWDWRYPTGDYGSITMWFTLCYQIFRILSKGKY